MSLTLGQFNDSFPPIMDGVANVVRNYAYWLEKKYGRCYVITPYVPNYKDSEDFDVLRYASLPVPGRYPYRAGIPYPSNEVKNKLINIPFDLVHAHSPFSAGQIALRVAKQRKIPLIASFHTKFYDDFLVAVKSKTLAHAMTDYVVKFYQKADIVWTLNQETKNTLFSYGYKGLIDIVPPGIDFPANYNKNTKESVLKPLEKDGCYEFLFVGQQVWHKNLKLLIEALELLKEWGINFRMTMTGEGRDLIEIKELVHQLNLTEQFRFTGKISDRDELQAVYSSAHLFLFPSVYDTFGLVVCEAASAGCPSLLIKNSSAAGIITEDYNGLLAENDSRSYALAIRNAISNPENLMQIGNNAAKTLTRSWESAIDEVALRYKEIIDNNREHSAIAR
ncbi:MAG: glycosyltransferase family 4 protein [Clostridiales bacterium]|nr:glycosyltransferase family 4 protein [Clostridiales bacterium]